MPGIAIVFVRLSIGAVIDTPIAISSFADAFMLDKVSFMSNVARSRVTSGICCFGNSNVRSAIMLSS